MKKAFLGRFGPACPCRAVPDTARFGPRRPLQPTVPTWASGPVPCRARHGPTGTARTASARVPPCSPPCPRARPHAPVPPAFPCSPTLTRVPPRAQQAGVPTGHAGPRAVPVQADTIRAGPGLALRPGFGDKPWPVRATGLAWPGTIQAMPGSCWAAQCWASGQPICPDPDGQLWWCLSFTERCMPPSPLPFSSLSHPSLHHTYALGK